jgi:hypothetical protein
MFIVHLVGHKTLEFFHLFLWQLMLQQQMEAEARSDGNTFLNYHYNSI